MRILEVGVDVDLYCPRDDSSTQVVLVVTLEAVITWQDPPSRGLTIYSLNRTKIRKERIIIT
jgi:hypothetical protein